MMVTVIVFPGTSMIAPLDMDIQIDNSSFQASKAMSSPQFFSILSQAGRLA